jgi:hypothetical protein
VSGNGRKLLLAITMLASSVIVIAEEPLRRPDEKWSDA